MVREDFLSEPRICAGDELREKLIDFSRRLGFERVTAMTVIDHSKTKSEFINVDNRPPDFPSWVGSEVGRVDPVMQYLKYNNSPIAWNQSTYSSVGKAEQWEQQEPFGYGSGIAIALHLPKGLHFCVGVNRRERLPNDDDEVRRMTAELCLFAVQTQQTAMQLMLPQVQEEDVPILTPRELECLRWTMEGKTAWETGRILGISEHTAIRHVNNATHKLGCINKHQAVLKAMRSKLIW